MPGQSLNNAAVDIPGRASNIQNGTSLALSPGVSQLDLQVRRVVAGQAAMVPLTVVDSCDSWPTFVGGGSAAF